MTPKSAAKRLRLERQQAIQRAMAIGLRARGIVSLRASDRFIPAPAHSSQQKNKPALKTLEST